MDIKFIYMKKEINIYIFAFSCTFPSENNRIFIQVIKIDAYLSNNLDTHLSLSSKISINSKIRV